MKVVCLSTWLPAPPDRVWAEVNTPRLLLHVAAPLMRFRPLDPPSFPAEWDARDYRVAMRLFGALPLGPQIVSITRPPPKDGRRFIRDNGHGPLIRRWDHLIEVAPEGEGTRYTDTVTIDAGWRTPLVTAFARRFYAHRQRRWRALAARGFDYEA